MLKSPVLDRFEVRLTEPGSQVELEIQAIDKRAKPKWKSSRLSCRMLPDDARKLAQELTRMAARTK